jgi:hypothetical protein
MGLQAPWVAASNELLFHDAATPPFLGKRSGIITMHGRSEPKRSEKGEFILGFRIAHSSVLLFPRCVYFLSFIKQNTFHSRIHVTDDKTRGKKQPEKQFKMRNVSIASCPTRKQMSHFLGTGPPRSRSFILV